MLPTSKICTRLLRKDIMPPCAVWVWQLVGSVQTQSQGGAYDYGCCSPLLLLLAACATTHAQDAPPTPTPLPENPETGCLYFANLVNIMERAMSGEAEPPEHPPANYVRYYRDTHFADEPQLYGAADVLFSHLAASGITATYNNVGRKDAWAAVAAARHIDRLCGAAGYYQASASPDVIVEYVCSWGGKLFAAAHSVKNAPSLRSRAFPECTSTSATSHEHQRGELHTH